jgi:hypothetical protein
MTSAQPISLSRPWPQCAALALLALALSVLFFSPRLWLLTEAVPGSFQWSRAGTFLSQCEQPLRRDIEPAMLWRLLPPLVAHGLHLPGKTPLVLPWLGVLAATLYAATLLYRQCADPRFVLGGTLLFTTTSAVIVPVGWLGMNDAWVWLGLLVVAFGRSPWSGALTCLLCPWVDERFIIGWPLAWLVGRLERGEPLLGRAAWTALALLPYLAIRLAVDRSDAALQAATGAFLDTQLNQSLTLLPLVPLGWWMGLRAAWVAAGYAVWTKPSGPRWFTLAVLLLTLAVTVMLASDLSRSVAITIPLVLAGCLAAARRHPVQAPALVLGLGCVNLLLPAAHVVHRHFDLINPLPVELFRLLR